MINSLLDPIFLSAGIPNREPVDTDSDLKPYVQDFDPILIREAILALVSVAIRKRKLIFGGHPAISPLVEHASRSLGAQKNVYIYQSRWFEKYIPDAAKRFDNLIWIEKKSTEKLSLQHMREKMISCNSFALAVFIGGMEGVEEEYKLFKKYHQYKPILPIASTRGAALKLFEENNEPQDENLRKSLINNHHYRLLLKQFLRDIER